MTGPHRVRPADDGEVAARSGFATSALRFRERDGLTGCIGCGCLSLRTCALSNPQDVASASGPGARHLARPLRGPVPGRADGPAPVR